jgi:carbon-monoxide dehydrogenase large subunit
MVSRLVGLSVRSTNGQKFVTGAGKFVDDLYLKGMLHAVFVRSRYAHAKIVKIDIKKAMDVGGAVAVIGGDNIKLTLPKLGMQGLKEPSISPLAVDRVRYVGEPIALCVASDLYAAYDMADRLEIFYEPLTPVTDPEKAAETKDILLYDDLGDNVALRLEFKGGDLELAFRDADVVIKRKIRLNRSTAAPIESRGTVASYNKHTRHLEVWTSTQFPHILRSYLAKILNLPENKVRVIACDVGGGFGSKAHIFREDIAIAYAAMMLGRPVKWFESRTENLQASIHEREQVHVIEIACKRDGKVLAVKDRCYADLGAYGAPPWSGGALSMFTSILLPGPYKLQAFLSEHIAVYTNKGPYGAVRGPALLQANYIIERVMDIVARELGLDPAEVRLKNLARSEEMPFTNLSGQAFNAATFDECLEKLLRLVDYKKLRTEQAEKRKRGIFMGIGFSILAEYGAFSSAVNALFGMGGFDSVKVSIDPSGQVTVSSGLPDIGQGISTALAQVVAEKLQVQFENVTVLPCDTSTSPYGVGSHSSRGAIIGGNAAAVAVERLLDKMKRIAAASLEADPRDIEYSGGRFFVKDDPSKAVSFMDVVKMAYITPHKLSKEIEPALEEVCFFEPASPITWANAAHAAVVEADPETGHVKVTDYYVVEDCGNVINPSIVEGQIIGGVVQGIGHILYEDLKYDEDGALLTSTFSEYLIPSAEEAPRIYIQYHVKPAPDNPGGYKGVGEGGTIAAPAAVVNAVEDALSPMSLNVFDAPVNPFNVWKALQNKRTA